MLISLELTNFRNHESLTINFTQGLNVIRAPNEGGKSNMLEALGYAWWGARALPFSLDDTVTWGKPTSSLKVKHSFSVNGAIFTITRSKSGAELLGPGVAVSGHEAVTNYVCNLFGADLKVGMSVLFAKQGALQGTLDGTAVSLIEQLSGMDVIDSAIVKMQAALPNGNTRGLEGQIASQSLLQPPVMPDDTAATAETAAEEVMQKAHIRLLAAEQAKSEATPAAMHAHAAIADIQVRNNKRSFLAAQVTALANPTAPTLLPVADTQVLRDKQAKAKDHARTLSFYKKLGSTHSTLSRTEFLAGCSQLAIKLTKLTETMASLRVEIATANAMRVTESACGLCGKDLQNVPEVVAKNAAIESKVARLTAELGRAKQELDDCTLVRQKNVEIELADREVSRAFSGANDLVSLDDSVIPAAVSWLGVAPDSQPDTTDYAVEISKAEAVDKANTKATAEYQAKLAGHASAVKELADLGSVEVIDGLSAQVGALADAESERIAALLSYNKATAEYSAAVKLVQHQREMYLQAFATYEQQARVAKELVELVKTTNFNNALIKKLREARPIVARGLWNNVLQGVSSIFSGIRGTESSVTRNDDGFLIDGKPYKMFSGSTQDSLGVAIRVMLQKTFLGSVDSIIFDEPASGADDNRETALIAALSRVEFSQVLLVTHSNLADAHAANIITL